MDPRAEYRRWLSADTLTPREREELESIREDDREIRERFFAPLEFGTAGLRGVMGAGIRRMNGHVICQATRALASLILEEGSEAARRGAVVCYDCRLNSAAYARMAACVLAACGIRVRLFRELRPTPELSFAIRLYGAMAGVNVTASHNPKEYNGYKVYWEDGGQLPPEHAARAAEAMSRLDVLSAFPMADYDAAVADGRILLLGEETDESFLREALGQSLCPGAAEKADLRIVYTPFYGAGAKLVPEALRRLGVRRLSCVTEQMEPDGTFPTAKDPNPEYAVGFERAAALARQVDADLIIGTDPDADRLGLMVREKTGGYRLLSGNQVGVLFLDHVLRCRRAAGTLPENGVCLKSVVSTEMARAAGEYYGVPVEDTFTGFKFLAEKMKQYESGVKTVLFSFEEAIGYAFGSFVRDKDAVTASVMAAEMASVLALEGKTLTDRLEELYAILGRYQEKTVSLVMPGLDGLEKMRGIMARLRQTMPETLGGLRVLRCRDYAAGIARTPAGEREELPMRGSDVLYYELEGDCRLVVRPSGTEPKIKIYLLVRGEDAETCERRVSALEGFARSLGEG